MTDATVPDDSGREPTDPRLTAGSRLGRYRIESLVGRGGMSEVYLARDPKLDRRVALKIMRLDRAAMSSKLLEREGRALAKVDHPSVVRVFDVGVLDDEAFVAMEYVDGESLERWLAEARPWEAVVARFLKAGAGLVAAHDAGVVHRDFKPANVILGKDDERVVVVDFGLARVAPRPRIDADAPVDTTSTFSLVGTPPYMAPEQLRGDPATVISDQFSFCVAMFEALHGVRPFDGRNVIELLAAMQRGAAAQKAGAKVPGWLGALMERGMSADPAKRYPSMRELLSHLDPAPRRRRRWVMAGVGAAAAVSAAWMVVGPGESPELECTGELIETMESTWGPSQRARVAEAFAASERPHAAQTGPRVIARIDAYVGRWTVAVDDACRTTAASGSMTRDQAAGAANCLRAQTVQVRLTARRLAEAAEDPQLVDRAIEVARALPVPRQCLIAPAVVEPGQREAALEVERARAQSVVARRSGDLALAKRSAATAIELAEALGAGPPLCDAMLEQAAVMDATASYDDAVAWYTRAMSRATEEGLVRRQALATMQLLRVVGDRQGRYGEAARWGELADALVSTLPPSDPLHGRLSWYRGTVAWRQGKADDAQALLGKARAWSENADVDAVERAGILTELGMVLDAKAQHADAEPLLREAVRLRQDALGENHPAVADALADLAVVAGQQGRSDDAIRLGEQALRIYERGVGPTHPHVGTIVNNLGIERAAKGQFDEALTLYDRSLGIREAALGPKHENVAEVLTNRGYTLHSLGRNEDATADLQRAIDIIEAAKGDDAPDLISALANLAIAQDALGNRERAIELHERGLALAEKVHGADHPAVGTASFNVGEMIVLGGDCERGVPLIERALKIFEHTLGAEHPAVAYPLTVLGPCRVQMGDPDRGVAELERALGVRTAAAVAPQDRGVTALALARARVRAGASKDKTAGAVRDAIAAFEEAGEPAAHMAKDARVFAAEQSVGVGKL